MVAPDFTFVRQVGLFECNMRVRVSYSDYVLSFYSQ